jgi:hypothetical protein
MRLTTLRSWAQVFIYLDFLCYLVWAGVAATLGVLVAVFALLLGSMTLTIGTGVAALHGVALLLFLAWMTGDARRSWKEIHRAHRRERPGPNGDLTNVASAPALPPWMGVL